nr:MAG TPA: hypothetical protein [Caudoviricetes sp.]
MPILHIPDIRKMIQYITIWRLPFPTFIIRSGGLMM